MPISLQIILLSMLFNLNVSAQENSGQPNNIPDILLAYNKGDVPYITVDSLSRNYNNFTILDTRKKAEYEVSHLPGAIWVGERFKNKRTAQIDKSKPIVVYCTVGVRSEIYGRKLLKKGFTDVSNLYGSIFFWKHAGHKVHDDLEKPTDSIHTFNKYWGRFLERGVGVHE